MCVFLPPSADDVLQHRDVETAVPVLFSNEATLALGLRLVPFSLFDLVTAEYDVRNTLSNSAEDFRRLGADRRRFKRVRAEIEQHAVDLGPGTTLIRVRDHDGKPDGPWPGNAMRGHPDFPRGRANVDGQTIIYCADSTETALAEVRATSGRYFTVASLQPRRLLKVASVVEKRNTGASNPFALIDLWMSTPVNDRNCTALTGNEQERYYATRLFSSIVREEGYDGVQFSSSVRQGGTNVALFDPCCLNVIETKLIRT